MFLGIYLLLDLLLLAAALWMLLSSRGFGGVFGKSLTTITVGALLLGAASLFSSLISVLVPALDAEWTLLIYRLIVLLGFMALMLGFQQIGVLNH